MLDELNELQSKADTLDISLIDAKIDRMMPELGFKPEDNDRLVASYRYACLTRLPASPPPSIWATSGLLSLCAASGQGCWTVRLHRAALHCSTAPCCLVRLGTPGLAGASAATKPASHASAGQGRPDSPVHCCSAIDDNAKSAKLAWPAACLLHARALSQNGRCVQ